MHSTYGLFGLTGSGVAIKSMRATCSGQAGSGKAPPEAPAGVIYCGGGALKRQIGDYTYRKCN